MTKVRTSIAKQSESQKDLKVFFLLIQRVFVLYWAEIVLGVLLLTALVIRLHFVTYPILLPDDGDTSRDYLIARHIAIFHEFPLVGPWNGAMQGFWNSPLYYYWLAFFVRMYDSILFVGLVNVILQIASGAVVYEIAKRIAGKSAGLIAAILFLLSDIAVVQSRAFWQPYSMQPFFLCMVLSFILAFQKKNNTWLLGALVLFVISGAMHNSAFGELPVVAVASIYLLFHNKTTLRSLFTLGFAVFDAFLLCYAPVIVAMRTALSPITRTLSHAALSWDGFSRSITTSLVVLERNYLGYVYAGLPINKFAGAIVAVCLVIYFFIKKPKTEKQIMIFLAGLFIAPMIMLSLLNVQPQDFYFTVCYVVGFIIVACVLVRVLEKGLLLKGFRWIVLFLLVFVCSGQFFVQEQARGLGQTSKLAADAVNAVTVAAQDLRQANGTSNYSFFGIVGYEYYPSVPITSSSIHAALLWAGVEKELNQKFTTLDMDIGYGWGYKPLTADPPYLFAFCRSRSGGVNSLQSCGATALRDFPRYGMEQQVFGSPNIMVLLMRRK